MNYSHHRFVFLPAFMALVAGATLSGCGGDATYSPAIAQSQGVMISISPLNPSVAFPNGVQFTATVTGTSNTGVNWSIVPGQEDPGTMTSGGLYSPAGNTNGSITIQAQSQADPSKTATTEVHVVAG